MTSDMEGLSAWFAALVDSGQDRDQAAHDAYQRLENLGLINRVRVHFYICGRGSSGCGVLGTSISLGGRVLLRTAPYKMSRGLNTATSVEAARRKNTLDGDRFWPGYTFDVEWLGSFGPDAAITMYCRHQLSSVLASTVLEDAAGVPLGRPGKTVLGRGRERHTGGGGL